MRTPLQRLTLAIVSWAVIVFLLAPIVVIVLSSLHVNGELQFSFEKLSLVRYVEFFSSARWMEALGISSLVAALAALLATAIALMAALAMARGAKRGRALFELGMLSPLILPHAAVALALYHVAVTFGLLGSFAGVLVAHVILTLPFAYRPIAAVLHHYDRSLDEAGLVLGATPAEVLWRVTVPLIRPGLISALLFSFIVSFDEVTVTMFLKGPTFATLPVHIFSEVQDGSARIVPAISTALVALTVGFMLIIERLVGTSIFIGHEAR